jgi:hypothetical protein
MSLKASTIPRLLLAEADTDIVAAGLPHGRIDRRYRQV